MTAPCIWNIPLKPVMSRLLWYLIDAGAVGNFLCHGWQRVASAQLGIHRITINRTVKRMVVMGILSDGDGKGEITVRPEVFKKAADQTKLRTRKLTRAEK